MGWLDKLEAQAQQKDFSFVPADEADGEFMGALPRTHYPYRRYGRDGMDSNVVMSPVNWILRNFTAAELIMERQTKGRWEPMTDHEIVEQVDRPNQYYNGDLLWKATLVSYCLDGNSYWLKVRNSFGGIVQLWYIPHFLIEPKWPRDGSEYISHYEYRPYWGGPSDDLQPRDVVHFRFGLDPRNTRKGLSPVKPILREVFTDDEAANFSASILRNMGVPGGVIAPKDAASLPSSEDVQEMRDYMRSAFSGDRRGEWLVLGSPTETSQFGFDPNQLMLGNLRDIAEERVCAALGIPAAVVGFGAGLQQTKVGATMRELRRLAWTSCVEPMQRSIAKQITWDMVPEYMSQTRRFRLAFDTSQVPAFQEEETELSRRIGQQVQDGILRVDQAQEILGLEVDDSQDVYLRPMGTVAVRAGEDPAEDRGPTGPSPNGSGPSGEEQELEETINRAEAVLAALKNGGD